MARPMSEEMPHETDPRDRNGPFQVLMTEIRACKATRRCPSLTSRSYYFEPNPATAAQWSASGLYTEPIDRRAMFVCESPGPQFRAENEVEPSRCWTKPRQDARFARAREAYGFLGCYLTNSVKCGVRLGSRHTGEELASCRGFLLRELELAFGGQRSKAARSGAENPVVEWAHDADAQRATEPERSANELPAGSL